MSPRAGAAIRSRRLLERGRPVARDARRRDCDRGTAVFTSTMPPSYLKSDVGEITTPSFFVYGEKGQNGSGWPTGASTPRREALSRSGKSPEPGTSAASTPGRGIRGARDRRLRPPPAQAESIARAIASRPRSSTGSPCETSTSSIGKSSNGRSCSPSCAWVIPLWQVAEPRLRAEAQTAAVVAQQPVARDAGHVASAPRPSSRRRRGV